MLRWTDLAEWRGPTPNVGKGMLEQRGMVVHIAQGSYEGTIGWQKNPDANVSSHFVVAGAGDAVDGKIAQVVDLDVAAWTQIDGNGHWVSVENSGFSPNKLTAAQFESNAQLYARGMRDFAWPARLATSPADVGLAYHGLACAGPGGDPRAPWTVENTSGQTWGHCDCPGAGVIGQLPAMLLRAIDINLGVDVTPDEVKAAVKAAMWELANSANNPATATDRAYRNDLWATQLAADGFPNDAGATPVGGALKARLDAIDATLAEVKTILAALTLGAPQSLTVNLTGTATPAP